MATQAAAGDVLHEAPGAPGKAKGRAQIVLDPSVTEIQPGEVLVCATTDPSWAPRFLAAAAVVCNVGAIGSHAAIVAREIGVPCAAPSRSSMPPYGYTTGPRCSSTVPTDRSPSCDKAETCCPVDGACRSRSRGQ